MEDRRKKCRRVGLPLLALLVCTLLSQQASAEEVYWYPNISFGAEYIQDWDDKDCLPESNLSWLYYTKPTVQYFSSKMVELNHKRIFLYGNRDAESTDIIEDDYKPYGEDGLYGDLNDLYVYAGHGGSNESNFWAPMCVSSRRRLTRTERLQRYMFQSAFNRWGERKLSLNKPQKTEGYMRWAIMDTCFSVPKNPHRVWEKTLGPRFEYLLGFRGYSASLGTTDEHLEDWAEYVYEDSDTFIGAWFEAIRDWFAMAMDGSVLTVGDTKEEAFKRLLNQSPRYPRRKNTKTKKLGYAWAWKNAFSRIHYYKGYINEVEKN